MLAHVVLVAAGAVHSWWPIALTTALAAAALGVRVARDDDRVWRLLAGAMAAWACGWLLWVAVYEREGAPPYPSVADALWLLFYAGTYAALVLVVQRDGDAVRREAWLDGLVGAAAAAAFVAQLASAWVTGGVGGWLARATVLAYPLADVALVGTAALVIGLRGWRPSPRWAAVAGALVLLAIADGVWSYRIAHDTYREGAPIDLLYSLTAGLFVVGAAVPRGRRAADEPPVRGTRQVPALLTVAVLGLLVWGDRTGDLHLAALVLACVAVLAGTLRWGVSVRREAEAGALRRLVLVDDVTGVASRRALVEDLQRRLDAGEPTAMMLLDLVGFRDLTVTLGHRAGDHVLKTVARRLNAHRPAGATLGRLDADVFGVVLTVAGRPAVEGAAERLLSALEPPIAYEDAALAVEASLGVAVAPAGERQAGELLRRAELALQAAKARGGGERDVYEPGPEAGAAGLELLAQLRVALAHGDLVAHYQPQVDLRTGQIVGVEALARWMRGGEVVLPAEFLPVAERSAIIRPLLLEMLDQALGHARRWMDAGHPLRVAVNASPRNLLDEGLPGAVGALLRRHGVPPQLLCLEVTESTVMTEPPRALRTLGALRALGVDVALDDFGVGHSSLGRLRELPIAEVKVDQTFVAAMRTSAADDVIIRSTVELGRTLGLRVVAEGVEDEATAGALRLAGCGLGQGWHFGRPVPAHQLDLAAARDA